MIVCLTNRFKGTPGGLLWFGNGRHTTDVCVQCKVVKCVLTDTEELDVAFYVKKDIDKTYSFRWMAYTRCLGNTL